MFFGKGDYVIAPTASAAAIFWMDHFDDLAYAKDFEELPDDEIVEIFIDPDGHEGSWSVFPLQWLRQLRPKGFVPASRRWPAREWLKHFHPGYLASTEED